MHAEHNYGQLGLFCPELFEQVKTSPSRQIYIEDDHVPALQAHEIKRLLGVACLSECRSFEFVVKYSVEALVNDSVIVNDQNLHKHPAPLCQRVLRVSAM